MRSAGSSGCRNARRRCIGAGCGGFWSLSAIALNSLWANLFNKDGLPAQTFRTDNWK